MGFAHPYTPFGLSSKLEMYQNLPHFLHFKLPAKQINTSSSELFPIPWVAPRESRIEQIFMRLAIF
jgi:hypothetical protein